MTRPTAERLAEIRRRASQQGTNRLAPTDLQFLIAEIDALSTDLALLQSAAARVRELEREVHALRARAARAADDLDILLAKMVRG